MDDKKLSDVLTSMPREKASQNFTAHVLQRLEKAPPNRLPRRFTVRIPHLAAAAVLLITFAFGGRELWHRHERQETLARYETLRAEHEALEAELHHLRRLSVDARPVLFLGGTEEVDYV